MPCTKTGKLPERRRLRLGKRQRTRLPDNWRKTKKRPLTGRRLAKPQPIGRPPKKRPLTGRPLEKPQPIGRPPKKRPLTGRPLEKPQPIARPPKKRQERLPPRLRHCSAVHG